MLIFVLLAIRSYLSLVIWSWREVQRGRVVELFSESRLATDVELPSTGEAGSSVSVGVPLEDSSLPGAVSMVVGSPVEVIRARES